MQVLGYPAQSLDAEIIDIYRPQLRAALDTQKLDGLNQDDISALTGCKILVLYHDGDTGKHYMTLSPTARRMVLELPEPLGVECLKRYWWETNTDRR